MGLTPLTSSLPTSLPFEFVAKILSLTVLGFLKIIGTILACMFIYYCIIYAIKRYIQKLPQNSDQYRNLSTNFEIVTVLLKFSIIIICALMILNILGIDLTPIFAFFSLIFVGMMIALQDTFKDLVSGMLGLSVNRIRIGDLVTINGFTGTVESTNWRAIYLRAADGKYFVIRFSSIQAVTNHTYLNGKIVQEVSVHYDTDISKLKAAIELIYKKLKNIYPAEILGPLELNGVSSLGDYSIKYSFGFNINPVERGKVQLALNELILDEFKKAQIVIPYPTTVALKE